MLKTMRTMFDALRVIETNPAIRGYLEEHDPQALKQVIAATDSIMGITQARRFSEEDFKRAVLESLKEQDVKAVWLVEALEEFLVVLHQDQAMRDTHHSIHLLGKLRSKFKLYNL